MPAKIFGNVRKSVAKHVDAADATALSADKNKNAIR